jgi:hypothetical protein
MTFSLRLTADLALALAARAIGGKHRSFPILHLSPENNFDSSSSPSFMNGHQDEHASFQSVARVSRYRSPIIWIGGSEPLDHPQVARFSNALAASGRHVFVETSGASLKQRLHEFRPSSRFHFVVRFDDGKFSCHHPMVAGDVFRIGQEAIRMARLAGFFTCANLVMHRDTPAGEIEGLHAEIHKLDVDGFLITSESFTPEIQKHISRVRRRLLNRRWALISSLLDSNATPAVLRVSQRSEQRPVPESQQGSYEEGVEA